MSRFRTDFELHPTTQMLDANVVDESDEILTSLPDLNIDATTYFWAAANAVLFVSILSGNILTIIAVRTCRRLRAVISNLFILSLAVSDLIVGLALPYHVVFYLGWNLGHSHRLCLLRFFLMIFACCVSLGTLISIAVDRYIAIVYALHYRRCMTRRVAYLIIALNWFVGTVIASIPMFWNNWGTARSCEFDEILPSGYVVGIITPAFIIIWSFMLILYWRIMREASKQARQLASCSDWKSIQIVVLIMGCFTICWLPYFIVVLTETFRNARTTTMLYKYALTLATSNSGLNPLIYAWKNSNFRKAFTRILCCRSPNCNIQKLEGSYFQSIAKSTSQAVSASSPTMEQDQKIIPPICDQSKVDTSCPNNKISNITTTHPHQQMTTLRDHHQTTTPTEKYTCAIHALQDSLKLQQNLNFDLQTYKIIT